MTGSPVLSVLTASLDRRDLLLRKLASLREQELQPELFEWVLVLDGSTDGSREAVEAALAEHPANFSVTILENLVPTGVSLARNRAAAVARGRVLYMSDDDCLPAADALRLHLQAQGEPAVYVGSLQFEDGVSWRPGRTGWWNVNGANTSVPAVQFRQAGGFPDYLVGYGGEDLGLGYALSRAGLEVRPLPAAQAVHLGPASMRSGSPDRWFQAGANAMRMARRHPEMAGRLGVARWQLAIKQLITKLPGRRARLEAAYLRGAREQARGQ